MCKTRWISIVFISILVLSAVSACVFSATTRFDAETMKAALRTTTVEEQGFIDYAIYLVKRGILPADLVDSTFMWARKKSTKYRFQYFKYALIVRAERMGIRM